LISQEESKVSVSIPGIVQSFEWVGKPIAVQFGERSLEMNATPKTDLFTDPETSQVVATASALVCRPKTEFILSAKVDVSFATAFDAGALVLWSNTQSWAKLCFEYSPQGQAMVVSVVTRGESDDCNAVVIEATSVWLRISGLGDAHAFHYSTDGTSWHFVRYFRLDTYESVDVGFEAQSPLGTGCVARFTNISFTAQRLSALRTGV
jgi:regulation of enolase protein 1 (concanavalin A-like superfamily)